MPETLVVDPLGRVRARCPDRDAAAAALDDALRDDVEWFDVQPGSSETEPAQWRLVQAPVVVFESRKLRGQEIGDYVARLDGRVGTGLDEDEAIADWLRDRDARPWPEAEDCAGCSGRATGPHKMGCSVAGAWSAKLSLARGGA